MPDNLSAQLTDSLQQAQLRAETMQQLQMVKNSLMGAGGIVAGGLAHGAAGAYAGMGMVSPFIGASSGFLNQAMGRGMYASASAFGPRVGGPGGLLYETGIGSALNRLSGGYLFQDVNKSISQTAEQMRDNSRAELRLRGQELTSNIKYGALTLGGLLDDSIAYRFTGGADERIKSGLTRQLAEQMGGAIGRTGTASGVVSRLMAQVGSINANQMGYGLGASQQEELAKLALAFGGPVGSTTKDIGDKSSKFLEDFSKSVGKLGVSADKLMAGYQELVKAGAANLDSAKLFQSSIQTARTQNLFGSFGTDEFITQLASQTAIAASSRGIRGVQAESMRNARFAAVAQATREFEIIGANQSGVFGTGAAGLQNLMGAREAMIADSMRSGGLFASTSQGAADQLLSGGFSGPGGMLRGFAGSTMSALRNPLHAMRYKLFPELNAAALASQIGAGGVLATAMNRSPAFIRNRLLRDLPFTLKQAGVSTKPTTKEDRMEVGKIIANAYGVTDEKQMTLFAEYLSAAPGALEAAAEGQPLTERQLAEINFRMSDYGILASGLNQAKFGNSVSEIIKSMSPSDISKLSKKLDTSVIAGERSALAGTFEQLYSRIMRDPSEADKLLNSDLDDRTKHVIRSIADDVKNKRKANFTDKSEYDKLFNPHESGKVSLNRSSIDYLGQKFNDMSTYYEARFVDPERASLTDEGFRRIQGYVLGRSEFASFMHQHQKTDGSVNKQPIPKVSIDGEVQVKVANISELQLKSQ